MTNNNTTTTLTDDELDWIITKTLHDDKILEYSKDIMAIPAFVLNEYQSSVVEKEKLYSTEQMLQMFRLGFRVMATTDIGKNVMKRKVRKVRTPYSVMRDMGVGDYTTFPYEDWNAARSVASKFKKDFGVKFEVNKIKRGKDEHSAIKVVRVS